MILSLSLSLSCYELNFDFTQLLLATSIVFDKIFSDENQSDHQAS